MFSSKKTCKKRDRNQMYMLGVPSFFGNSHPRVLVREIPEVSVNSETFPETKKTNYLT